MCVDGAAVSRGVPEECVSEHRRGGARRETTASERESVYMVAHRSQVACAHATGKCTVLDPNEYTYHADTERKKRNMPTCLPPPTVPDASGRGAVYFDAAWRGTLALAHVTRDWLTARVVVTRPWPSGLRSR